MSLDLSAYLVAFNELTSSTKQDGMITAIQNAFNNIGNPAFGAFASGLIFDPAKIQQSGATTGQILVWNGAAWAPAGGAASTYTPTYTQSGAVTKTVTLARYIQIGKLVFVQVTLTATGAGTAFNTILVGLPVTAQGTTGTPLMGSAYFTDASGPTDYPLAVFINSTTTVAFNRTDALPTNTFGKDPNFAIAAGDVLYAHLLYEAA